MRKREGFEFPPLGQLRIGFYGIPLGTNEKVIVGADVPENECPKIAYSSSAQEHVSADFHARRHTETRYKRRHQVFIS